MIVEWSERAEAELHLCAKHIAQDNPVAAFELIEIIVDKVETLLPENPEMGRPGRVGGTRELIVHANYLVAYQIADKIQILSVVHAARLWPQTF